jgi:hypothetical protein
MGIFLSEAEILNPPHQNQTAKDQIALSYHESFFASQKKRNTRAKKSWRAIEKNPSEPNLTSDLFYSAVAEINLDDTENLLILLNAINLNPQLRQVIFRDVLGEKPSTRIPSAKLNITQPDITTLDQLSDDVLQARLGIDWKKLAADKKIAALKAINDGMASLVNLTTAKRIQSLKEKFETDINFAFNFFTRWQIPDSEETLSPEVLLAIALKNPGAALGILFNQKLGPILASVLSKNACIKLLENAETASKDKKCQHYIGSTLTQLLNFLPNPTRKEFIENLDMPRWVLNAHEPIGLLKSLILKADRDKSGSNIKDNDFIDRVIDQSISLICAFDEQHSKGKFKSQKYHSKSMIQLMETAVPRLMGKFAKGGTQAQATDLKKLYNNPKIVRNLNLPVKVLVNLYPIKKREEVLNVTNLSKKEFRSHILNQATISDELAFTIVQRPELWAKLNPNQYRNPFKRLLNRLFGAFQDEFEGEKSKLIQKNNIFAQKLNGEEISPPLAPLARRVSPKPAPTTKPASTVEVTRAFLSPSPLSTKLHDAPQILAPRLQARPTPIASSLKEIKAAPAKMEKTYLLSPVLEEYLKNVDPVRKQLGAADSTYLSSNATLQLAENISLETLQNTIEFLIAFQKQKEREKEMQIILHSNPLEKTPGVHPALSKLSDPIQALKPDNFGIPNDLARLAENTSFEVLQNLITLLLETYKQKSKEKETSKFGEEWKVVPYQEEEHSAHSTPVQKFNFSVTVTNPETPVQKFNLPLSSSDGTPVEYFSFTTMSEGTPVEKFNFVRMPTISSPDPETPGRTPVQRFIFSPKHKETPIQASFTPGRPMPTVRSIDSPSPEKLTPVLRFNLSVASADDIGTPVQDFNLPVQSPEGTPIDTIFIQAFAADGTPLQSFEIPVKTLEETPVDVLPSVEQEGTPVTVEPPTKRTLRGDHLQTLRDNNTSMWSTPTKLSPRGTKDADKKEVAENKENGPGTPVQSFSQSNGGTPVGSF